MRLAVEETHAARAEKRAARATAVAYIDLIDRPKPPWPRLRADEGVPDSDSVVVGLGVKILGQDNRAAAIFAAVAPRARSSEPSDTF